VFFLIPSFIWPLLDWLRRPFAPVPFPVFSYLSSVMASVRRQISGAATTFCTFPCSAFPLFYSSTAFRNGGGKLPLRIGFLLLRPEFLAALFRK